jgi:hypothetical protein
VTETEYFGHLEMRVSRELEGMRQPELRGWWCDGFIPEKLVVTRSGSHVAGRAWVDAGKRASEGEGHRSPPGTVVITYTDVVSLGLFFIGAPFGGISSLYFAWRNAERHRGAGGTAFARGLTFYAVASTLLGWALCAGIMFYIMGSRPPR